MNQSRLISDRLLRFFAPLSSLVLPACGEMAPEEMPPPAAMAMPDPDCPPDTDCEVIPAAYKISNPMTGSYGNYDLADRPTDGLEIRYIVIHDTDTFYDDALTIFKDPANQAAAHYVVRNSDGHIAKMISPKNVAWHAGNWYYNIHSVGIEHSGWAFEGWRWYSEELYQASAKLVRFLAKRYNVPLDRAHILGHEEIPGGTAARQKTMHWDPGPYWDWDHYMKLLQEPDEQADSGQPGVIAIRPQLAGNIPSPALTYCFGKDEAEPCHAVVEKPVNFVFLRTAPDPTAPLIKNQYLLAAPDDRVSNWGNRAATGRLYYRAERQGDWDGIFFGGEKVWFHNPDLASTRVAHGIVITPKSGMATIPVYGFGYPGDGAFAPPTMPQTIEKIYDLPSGQFYVARLKMTADYYWAKTYQETLDKTKNIVVSDATEYYQLDFNHRVALVKASDVDEVK